MAIKLVGLPTKTGTDEGNGMLLDLPQGQAFGKPDSFKGKVLVTHMTNPGMIRQIKESVAVVCERGGRTCHAAVVCGEIGKPCVVGVSKLIETYNTQPKPVRIQVNGETGEVHFKDFVLVED